MNACVNETIDAAPTLRTKPNAITGHIIYKPPATAPVGIYNGPVNIATNGCNTFFVAKPKLANNVINTKSTVAIRPPPLLRPAFTSFMEASILQTCNIG
ncbi:MAG: hypothetical protein NWF04_01225 [Candidatus Bathyarchaeota archaeon]|nr:hypothetical protein [Candidatus Bathyarchaeota archaeon]